MNAGMFVVTFLCLIRYAVAGGGFSNGKQFMLTFMPNHDDDSNTNNYLFITSIQSGTVHIVIPGDGTVPVWKHSYAISAGETTMVSLPKQPVLSDVTSVEHKIILIYANSDIAVYAGSVNRQMGWTDATVVLPITFLSSNYVLPSVNPMMAIAALENTTVTLEVASACPLSFKGRGVQGASNVTLHLKEYGVLQMKSPHWNKTGCDFGGSRIIANKPVAVFLSSSSDVSTGILGHRMMQVVPAELWGRRFIVPELACQAGYQVRIVSSADSIIYVYEHHNDLTTHMYELEMDSWTTRTLIVPNGTLLEVFASRGVHLTQSDSGPNPVSVPVPAVENYGFNYTFTTIGVHQSHNYVNYINIVAHTNSVKTMTIDGKLLRPTSWRRVHDLGFSVATIPVSKGSHTITADNNFMLQVYGFSNVGSYGYIPGYYFETLPSVSEQLTLAIADELTSTTTTTTTTTPVTETLCRNQPGVNCAVLDVSVHICKIPTTNVHYCRKYCNKC